MNKFNLLPRRTIILMYPIGKSCIPGPRERRKVLTKKGAELMSAGAFLEPIRKSSHAPVVYLSRLSRVPYLWSDHGMGAKPGTR